MSLKRIRPRRKYTCILIILVALSAVNKMQSDGPSRSSVVMGPVLDSNTRMVGMSLERGILYICSGKDERVLEECGCGGSREW